MKTDNTQAPAQPLNLVVGGRYNWKGQPERLIYTGDSVIRGFFCHQFAKVEAPYVVCVEATRGDLSYLEATPTQAEAKPQPVAWRKTHQIGSGLAYSYTDNPRHVATWLAAGFPLEALCLATPQPVIAPVQPDPSPESDTPEKWAAVKAWAEKPAQPVIAPVWMPIETAPKDRTIVLHEAGRVFEGRFFECKYQEDRDIDGRYVGHIDAEEYWMDDATGDECEPTDWREKAPLPAPPTPTKSGGAA